MNIIAFLDVIGVILKAPVTKIFPTTNEHSQFLMMLLENEQKRCKI